MRKLFIVIGVVVLLIAVGGGIAGSMLLGRLNEPYKGYETAEQFVEIPPGTSVAEIRRRLVEAGVVRDELTFRAALWRSGRSQALQAGEYRFAEPLRAVDVIDRLARGEVYTRRLTFPEGLTINEMAKTYETRGFGRAADFVRAASDPKAIAELDPEAPDLEGYLFPETYPLRRDASAAVLVKAMVDRFLSVFDDELRQRAQAQGLTVRQVVTLAALVEKETARDEERPQVAAVYRNRMMIGMPMQADPTLIYALQKAGRYDGNIRKADMGVDSPYNTYKYPGLPPGPIAAPGKASLVAVLNPADVPYLFFVSRNDGTHVFADTLAKHNENVRRFQIEYFRAQRRAAGAGDRAQGTGDRAVSGNSR